MSMASWRKISFCLRASVAVWCAAATLYASTPDGVAPTSVAPNQSISLTDAGPSRDKPVAQGASGQSADDGESNALATTGSREPGPARSSTIMRPRGAVRSVPLGAPSSGLTVPWYRSGLASLAIVLGLVAGVYWLIRKFVPSCRVSDSSVVRVVARSSLSPKHNVALLRIGRRFVLVGVSGDRMNTLSEITDADEVAELVAKVGGGPTAAGGVFEKLITREADAFGAGMDADLDDGVVDESPGPMVPSRRVVFHGSGLSQLRDRLRGLQKKQ